MHVVSNKQEMYKLLLAGKFGNTARIWDSYADLLASSYKGLVGIRSMVPGGVFLPYVSISAAPREGVRYSEMQDDGAIVLQGELYRSVDGLYLLASSHKTHMRDALRQGGKHYWLSAAYAQLQTALWPSDYDNLMELLAEYPDSVIEFSAYCKTVGIIPNRNTIIWEVRNY